MNNEQGMMNNEVKTTSYFEISCSKFDILNSYLMLNGSSLRGHCEFQAHMNEHGGTALPRPKY
jgi:hypothetical protein